MCVYQSMLFQVQNFYFCQMTMACDQICTWCAARKKREAFCLFGNTVIGIIRFFILLIMLVTLLGLAARQVWPL
ncbi:hypothetical protein BGI51_22355 [Pseudomonas oryzihabitans]|nr:hypothetical protein BGI51_22355 [Pseudomonas psychrotolerans]